MAPTASKEPTPAVVCCRPRRRRVWWLMVVVAALALAACGESSDTLDSGVPDFAENAEPRSADDFAADEESEEESGRSSPEVSTAGAQGADDDGDAAPTATQPTPAGSEVSDADSLGAAGPSLTPTAADFGRKLIFTADIAVGVDDVTAASADASTIIGDLGGFLFGQETVGGAEPRSVLTFKVLPGDFDRALGLLGGVGELRNQTVTTDDVTERVVDLESRISVAELGVTRLRTALETAPSLTDFAEIERLLLERESDLEVMRGQLRTLSDRIDLATITLTLSQDRVENAIDVNITSYQGHDGGESCPGPNDGSVEAGGDATVCFEIVNVGDQTLTDIVVTDTVLEIDEQTELIEVFGSLDELAPGQTAVIGHEIRPDRTVRLRTRITAVPTDGVSAEPVGPSVSTQVESVVRTFEADTDPGFGDGFSAGISLLSVLWVGAKVVVGFLLLPALILAIPVWFVWRRWRRRRRAARSLPVNPPPAGPGGADVASPAAVPPPPRPAAPEGD